MCHHTQKTTYFQPSNSRYSTPCVFRSLSLCCGNVVCLLSEAPVFLLGHCLHRWPLPSASQGPHPFICVQGHRNLSSLHFAVCPPLLWCTCCIYLLPLEHQKLEIALPRDSGYPTPDHTKNCISYYRDTCSLCSLLFNSLQLGNGNSPTTYFLRTIPPA